VGNSIKTPAPLFTNQTFISLNKLGTDFLFNAELELELELQTSKLQEWN